MTYTQYDSIYIKYKKKKNHIYSYIHRIVITREGICDYRFFFFFVAIY